MNYICLYMTLESIKPLHFLLADDDEDDRHLFTEALNEAASGIQVSMVKDGEELMKLLNEKNIVLPDIIFLDLNMPCKDGLECLKEILKTPHLKNIPVIIYSTSTHIKDINETFELGAFRYINKPNSFTGLTAIIKKVLELEWKVTEPNTDKSEYILKV